MSLLGGVVAIVAGIAVIVWGLMPVDNTKLIVGAIVAGVGMIWMLQDSD